MKHLLYPCLCLLLFSAIAPLHLCAQTSEIVTSAYFNSGNTFRWKNDRIYLLDGRVVLPAGKTLRIDAGTVIKGKAVPSADDYSALIIAPGARLYARGQANAPIIFTAETDEAPANSNRDVSYRGLWGGLYIFGAAPVAGAGAFPADEVGWPAFGGTQPGDNSGVLRYVSVRHGGKRTGGRSLPSLLLGGVGRGTQVDYVEVAAGGGAGIVVAGGTVNPTHLAAAFCSGDAFVLRQGWSGGGQFWFSLAGPLAAGSAARFLGTLGGTPARPTVYNATFIGSGAASDAPRNPSLNPVAVRFENNAAGALRRSIISEGAQAALEIGDQTQPADSYDQLAGGALVLEDNLWWGFGQGNRPVPGALIRVDAQAAHPDADEVRALFTTTATAPANRLVNPFFGGLSREATGNLDPRPYRRGPAFLGAAATAPGGGTFRPARYRGAFGNRNWLSGWSALDQYGHLARPTGRELPPAPLDKSIILSLSPQSGTDQRNSRRQPLIDAGLQKADSCWCDTDRSGERFARLELWVEDPNSPLDSIELYTIRQGANSDIDPETTGDLNIVVPKDQPGSKAAAQLLCDVPFDPPNPGSKDIRVAIIDSGVNLPTPDAPGAPHADLNDRVYINTQEAGGVDHVDDDHNFLVDDRYGADYTNHYGGPNETKDDVNHGTLVAGVVHRDFPADVKLELMNIKVVNVNERKLFDMICGIHHAIDQGAQVINLSLGYNAAMPCQALYGALKRAEAAGITVVTSAGNEGVNIDREREKKWPAAFKRPQPRALGKFRGPVKNLIVVAALNRDLTGLQEDSNFGEELVDVAAPGEAILTTSADGQYAEATGTSVAAAYVSRLAAILQAQYPDISMATAVRSWLTDPASMVTVTPALPVTAQGRFDARRMLDIHGQAGPSPGPLPTGPLRVRPEGFNNYLHLDLGEVPAQSAEIRLIDGGGREFFQSETSCRQLLLVLDDSIPPGTYQLVVRIDDGEEQKSRVRRLKK